MTELHVQRKRHSYGWVWAIILLVIAMGAIYYYLHSKNPKAYPTPGKTTGYIVTTSGYGLC